jgi:hypothetical protein
MIQTNIPNLPDYNVNGIKLTILGQQYRVNNNDPIDVGMLKIYARARSICAGQCTEALDSKPRG